MISVIMYVFDDEKYLYSSINSLLKQSYQNFEIICIDDFSTDASFEILEYFQQKDQRVKPVKMDAHKGFSYIRNLGMRIAQGKYVLFLEGADWYSLDALEEAFNESEKNNLDILMFKSTVFEGDVQDFKISHNSKTDLLSKFEGKIFNKWDLDKTNLFKIPMDLYNKLYLKSFLEKNNIFFSCENHSRDDILFFCKVIISAERISFMDKYFYNHREISDLNVPTDNELLDNIHMACLILEAFFANRPVYDYYKKEVLMYIFNSIFASNYNLIDNPYKEKFFIQTQNIIKKFIEEYGLYEDIKENVDENLLNFFEFEDLTINYSQIKNTADTILNKNELFSLWIPDNGENELPILAYLSLRSMILCGHEVVLYTYQYLNNVPNGVQVRDANEIIHFSKIFRYAEGHKTYSGFANLFRLKRLYEFGGTWMDLDVLLIRNINEKLNNNYIIVSEPTKRFYLHPNNAILRFPKNDALVKEMLDIAMEKGSDVVHGETGPKLVSKMLKTSFKQYNSYLKHFNFNNILKWNDIEDYSKKPKDLLNNINMDEIIGFHMFNTFFNKIIDSFDSDSFFGILKRGILNSKSNEEYKCFLKKYDILKTNANYDLKFLSAVKKDMAYTYALLIDAKNLKKSEIYNIFHSIGVDKSYTLQVFVFSRTSLPNDKVKFNDNFYMFSSSFDEIYYDIKEYIQSEYIIPINKPLMFNLDFFKEKNMDCDIEQYQLNKPNSLLNIFSRNAFENLVHDNIEHIFNLPSEKMDGFEVNIFKNELIYDYSHRANNMSQLIALIDGLNENPDMFLETKNELMNLKFKNLVDEVSFYYYTSYKNIINSNNYEEFVLNEDKSNLEFLTSFYLNKLNEDYEV